MGAKTWMIAYSDGKAEEVLKLGPQLDRSASAALAKQLFPSDRLEQIDDGDLSYTCPENDEIYVGCFPGLRIVAATEFGIDYPSKLPRHFLDVSQGQTVYLHAMHSVVDWFAYGIWENGKLVRSLSLAPDNGILEDIGARLALEEPYWSGSHPVFEDDEEDEDQYPFPFHPLELGEAVLLHMFGYQLEGIVDSTQVEPEEITLAGFRRRKPWWRLW